jgi:universal stress protein A
VLDLRKVMSYKHILVAVDLSQSSQIVIDKAISLAKGANCKLSFVFVDVDKVVLAQKEKLTLQKELQTLADQSDYPITDTLVVIGDLHIKLSGIVKEMDIDLVVCGHHHTFLSRLFSSVPKLANAVETDLLVVYLDQ